MASHNDCLISRQFFLKERAVWEAEAAEIMLGIYENGPRLYVVSYLSEAALLDYFEDPWAVSPCKQNIYLIVLLVCWTVPA